jgi:GntR family colanic acid and biofilm gene transcriptional regulator
VLRTAAAVLQSVTSFEHPTTMILQGSDEPSDKSQRIAHSNLSTKVYESLRGSLANGEMVPGQKLSARSVVDRLGVSQTPVREAMLQLVAERALAMNRNKSVTVPTLTADTYIELRDMRVALESLACRCAVEFVTEADIESIEQVHRQMIAAKRAFEFGTTLRLNREVHLGIYSLSHRPELLALIESLWVRTGPYLNLIYQGSGRLVTEPHEHERLFTALRARDPEEAAASIARDIIKGNAPVIEALKAAATKS